MAPPTHGWPSAVSTEPVRWRHRRAARSGAGGAWCASRGTDKSARGPCTGPTVFFEFLPNGAPRRRRGFGRGAPNRSSRRAERFAAVADLARAMVSSGARGGARRPSRRSARAPPRRERDGSAARRSAGGAHPGRGRGAAGGARRGRATSRAPPAGRREGDAARSLAAEPHPSRRPRAASSSTSAKQADGPRRARQRRRALRRGRRIEHGTRRRESRAAAAAAASSSNSDGAQGKRAQIPVLSLTGTRARHNRPSRHPWRTVQCARRARRSVLR